MGLIYNILKHTETKRLPTPIIQIDVDRVQSKMERQHLETLTALQKKEEANIPLTPKERRAFRSAVNGLKRRGLAKIIETVEVDRSYGN